MQLIKYGICLESLTEPYLETVREWRNADHIRLSMEFKEIITSEKQKAWFDNLDHSENIYFLIKIKETPVGIVNLKNIKRDLSQAEAGIFIGELEYLNSLTPILSTISIMEFAFEVLKIKTLKAKIGIVNYMAILFNENLGYIKCDSQTGRDFHYYETNEHQFNIATQNIRQTLNKINNSGYKLILSEREKELFRIDINNPRIPFELSE